MDTKKELQARLDLIKEKLKHEKITDSKSYRVYFRGSVEDRIRVYFRGFVAGRIRGYTAEIYFLEGLIMALDEM